MKQQSGSALIMAVCISAVLVIATTTSWYTASLMHDAACARQQRFQRKQSVYALLTYITPLITQQFDELAKATEPTLLYQGAWPSDSGLIDVGYARSCQDTGGLKVVVTLERSSTTIAATQALFARDATDAAPVVMIQWDMDEMLC